jgi:hypothetical protein
LETNQLDAIMNGLLHERSVALAIATDRERYAEQLKEEAATSKIYTGQITALIGEGMRAAQQRNWEGALGSVSWREGQLQVEAEEGKVDLDFYEPVLDRSLLDRVALDIHDWREAIEGDAALSKAERERALAKLPQLKGVTVKRGPEILKVRSGTDKGGDW